MNYMELDTPALIIDREIMMDNLRFMQEYADRRHVALRPHTKTHKMPRLALIQEELGARGVTVAKVGEAEVMAEAGQLGFGSWRKPWISPLAWTPFPRRR